MADTYLSPNRFCFYLDKEYKFDYPKKHIFASLIGNVRSERTYLVDKLVNNNIKILICNADYTHASGRITVLHYFL